MKILLNGLFGGFFMMPCCVWATETVSPSSSALKMVVGLAVVLAVMALVAWMLKRMMPSMGNNKQSVARVVGGVSVGSRERVVVVEIADRWIVVGVAPGQVNGIANLEANSLQLLSDSSNNLSGQLDVGSSGFTQTLVPPFAQWLQKSTAKFTEFKTTEKKDAKE
jgi:flagellar protein FliO/FliZ